MVWLASTTVSRLRFTGRIFYSLPERHAPISVPGLLQAVDRKIAQQCLIRTLPAEMEGKMNRRPLLDVSGDSLDILRPTDFLHKSVAKA
ncbi:unnamed protein product [Toxocara canis]|uniref:Tetraacyldisaccharide 4'-kinase n=1 Tax=Toxocara canis TaxID=6265 RepID=A0A183VFB4_TOXCA|nr:unnamed protein product [Toxocara canis]